MPQRRLYKLVYDREVADHLAAIDRKYHSLIRRTMEKMLTHEPEVETGQRKPLVRPSLLGATWELRLGPANRFRVFYRTRIDFQEVQILAIGAKEKNRLYIGRREFKL